MVDVKVLGKLRPDIGHFDSKLRSASQGLPQPLFPVTQVGQPLPDRGHGAGISGGHPERKPLIIPYDKKRYFSSDRRLLHQPGELPRTPNAHSVELNDDVTILETCVRGRAPDGHRSDNGTLSEGSSYRG